TLAVNLFCDGGQPLTIDAAAPRDVRKSGEARKTDDTPTADSSLGTATPEPELDLRGMDALRVHGGAPLHGEIRVRGAKNFVSKAMVATLLGEAPSRLFDVPRMRDVDVVSGLLELHGVKVTKGALGEMVFDPSNVESAGVDEINVHAGSSRIPILLCGPLLHR